MGWPWGWFPWTRGWDFLNEARCEMVGVVGKFKNFRSCLGLKGIGN